MFDNFAPDAVKNNPKARTEWAIDTVKKAATASRRLGLKAHATFSGSLLWHTLHPWPQRPKGLVEMGFEELAKRWMPILNHFDKREWMYATRYTREKISTTEILSNVFSKQLATISA
jgi:hypothetical protein